MPVGIHTLRRRPLLAMAIGGVSLGMVIVAMAEVSHATSSLAAPAAGPVTIQQCPRDRVQLVAHRGTGAGTRAVAGHAYTEDTLPAFEKAMVTGADGFETDYWPTGDQRIVSLHDATLARTTNGTGAVWTLRWSYIHRVVTPSGAGIPTVATVEAT